MIVGITILSLLSAQPDIASLSYKTGNFTIKSEGITLVVPLKEQTPIAPKAFRFEDGSLKVAWTNGKMTVQRGKYERTTNFVDVPTSPRLFSKEQIRETIRAVENGERPLGASAVVGHELVGDTLYFLMRWADKTKKPIFEALISLDLTLAKPWFKVQEKLPGLSTANGPVSDLLFTHQNHLAVIATQGPKWGLATWDLSRKFMQFTALGSGLARFSIPKTDPDTALFVEKTDYGNWLCGSANLATRARSEIADSKDKVSFVSANPLIIRFDSPEECRVRYAESGLEQAFSPWTAARLTPKGLLMWHPATDPKQAVLFKPESFDAAARWSATKIR
ncbi:MAG: hypothetical protein JST40_01025 [Armatimonadetes bacterium]|nr:hypothetical protein [Armatimonadota bacterium]